MKKLGSVLVLACVMLLGFTTSCDDVDYDVFGTITGTVVDKDNGEPLSDVRVTLSPSGANAFTGSDGHFEFLELEATQYTVTAQKTGYKTDRTTVTISAGGVQPVTMSLKKEG